MVRIRKWGLLLMCSAAAVLSAASGLLYRPDMAASDALYQTSRDTGREIVIVGMDEKALEEIGPYQTWGRDIMARVLDYLNAGEDCHPAVIGIDVLYTGETEEAADAWLAEAAGAYGNVVTASAARFGSSLTVEENGSFYMDTFRIQEYEEPYKALRDASGQGHINAMLDKDGILRHSLSRLTLEDGRQIPSFAAAIADKYFLYTGEKSVKMPPADANGFFYVPFSGKPGDYYEGISVSDLLDASVPPEYFNGRIVLIGPYAAGFMDSYITAADHAAPMYGVEYQANVINVLLQENYKEKAGEAFQLILLGIMVFLCGIWFYKRGVIGSAVLWAGVSGGWLVLCRALYAHGIILHVLWTPAAVTILFVLTVAVNYIRAAAEKRRVTSTFKRYVAPEIVNEILKEGTEALELGGKQCEITVLFVDIRGFTTMSEALEPPRVVEILNQYLTLTSSCIMKNQGTLDKFVGDATMAFWGAPLPQEDAVMKAVKAALDMTEGSRALAEELQKQFGRSVSFGIGIHTGPAVVGNIGAKMRMDYTAIGDTVNTAARLEANAPGGTIYISRAVADALEGRIRAVSLGNTIKLKGKADGFEVLRLEGLADV